MIRTYKERWWMVPGATLKRKRAEEHTGLPTPVSPAQPRALPLRATPTSSVTSTASTTSAVNGTSGSESTPVEAAAQCATSSSSPEPSSKSTPNKTGVSEAKDKPGAEATTPEKQLTVSTDLPRIPHRPRPPVPRLKLEREFPPPPFRLRPTGSPPPPPPELESEIGPEIEVDSEGVMRMFLKRRKLDPGPSCSLTTLETACDADLPSPAIENGTTEMRGEVVGMVEATGQECGGSADEMGLGSVAGLELSPFDTVDASIADLQLPLPEILSSDSISPVTPISVDIPCPGKPATNASVSSVQLLPSQANTASLEKRIRQLEEGKTDLAAELQAQKVGSSLLCEELRVELRAKTEEVGTLVVETERLRRENEELRGRLNQQGKDIPTQLAATQPTPTQQGPTQPAPTPTPQPQRPPAADLQAPAKQAQVPTPQAQLAHPAPLTKPNPEANPSVNNPGIQSEAQKNPDYQSEARKILQSHGFALHQVQQALWSEQQYSAHLEQEIGRREAERNALRGYVAELQGRLQMCALEWNMMMIARRGQMQGQMQDGKGASLPVVCVQSVGGPMGPAYRPGMSVRPVPQPQSAVGQAPAGVQQTAGIQTASRTPSFATARSASNSVVAGRPPPVVGPALNVQQSHPQPCPTITIPAISRQPANVRPVTGAQQVVPRPAAAQLTPHIHVTPGTVQATANGRPSLSILSPLGTQAQQAVQALQTAQAFHLQPAQARQAWLFQNPQHPQRSVSMPQPISTAHHGQVARRSVSLPQTTTVSLTQPGQSQPCAAPQAPVSAPNASIQ